ncbi:MAG: DNA alkylation repair protein [Clostridia bacterium]|nr:DNA alkylation repair protein [Clostridia bacterium]
MLDVKKELKKYVKEDVDKFKYFHKTDKGEYAEKDIFLGITVPDIRKVAKQVYNEITLNEVQELLNSKYHEERLCALVILVLEMKKADEKEQQEIVNFYLNNTRNINGWDLVDLSAPYILGEYILKNKDKVDILYTLSDSEDMWKQRISIVANWTIIRKGEYSYILELAEKHLDTKYDLISKAVGWMLREVGKKDYMVEYNFLKNNYKNMPRTMLRYSIEKFDEEVRQKFLKGEI